MTRSDAIDAIAEIFDGHRISEQPLYRFPNVTVADRVKAILDAILPTGSTGAVAGPGFLMVTPPREEA